MQITRLFALFAVLPGLLGAAAPAPRVSGLPFFFLENRGIANPRARYFMRRPELSAYFMENEIMLAIKGHNVAMLFPSADAHARIEGIDAMEGAGASFFLGSDANKWVKDIPMDRAVAYRALWPGIDMVYSGNGRTLKSEFRVRPGADPNLIRWSYNHPFHASLSPDGSLSVSGEGLDMREDAPVIYQEKNGAKVGVTGSFHTFPDGSAGFHVGDYDRGLPLVIDPTLTFSTFVGGNGQDEATAVAVDPNGNAYLAGWTNSTNFAQSGPAKWKPFAGSTDAFVAKFSALGDKLIYCTYFGGSGDDRALGLAVDASGSVYLTGYTTSTNFPVSSFSPIQAKLAGKRNAFITRLNSTGNALVYSTYLGGEGTDIAYGIAVDGGAHAFITGDTTSLKFPVTTGTFQAVNHGSQNAFAAEVNLNGTSLLWSTYLGGSSADHASAIAINSVGNVFITGYTQSPDFPTANAFQPVTGGNQDAFVAGIAAGGKTLLFSTYLGGSGGTPGLPEEGDGIVLDPSSNIVVSGTTSSLNFPVTATGFQKAFAGGNTDGFLVKLDPTGKTLIYGTYIGGSSVEHVTGVATDQFGYTYVAGYTSSQDFPNIRAPQNSNHGEYDGFLYKLNPAGTSLVYATYVGGTAIDAITSLAVDRFGSVVMGGYTASGDFPLAGVLGSAQKYKYGTTTAFLSKITSGWVPVVADSSGAGITFSVDQAHDLGNDGVSATFRSITMGQAGDIPVFGDWNGSGTGKIGIVRNGVWMLDYNGNGVWDGPAGGDRQFTFGPAGSTPIVGDWDGSGTVKAGWYSNGYWALDMSGLIQGKNTGAPLRAVYFGTPGDIPVVGDWSGNGTTKIGVVRQGYWRIDTDGDYIFNPAPGLNHDQAFFFGSATDVPFVGDWDGSGTAKPGVYRNGTWFLGYELLPPVGYFGAVDKVAFFTFGGQSSIPFVGK
jgi:hypothetical protein